MSAWTENRSVGGSIPPPGTILLNRDADPVTFRTDDSRIGRVSFHRYARYRHCMMARENATLWRGITRGYAFCRASSMSGSAAGAAAGSAAGRHVGLATVMAGAQPVRDPGIPNINPTYHGLIMLEDGDLRAAFLKDLPPKELANEVFAAALGAELQLPVPRSFIARAPAASLMAKRCVLADGSALMFASFDAESPSVSQLVMAQADPNRVNAVRRLVQALVTNSALGELYGFDAWVANIDRHIGNLLFGAAGSFHMIDHGHCFTGDKWTASDLVPSDSYVNRMASWVTPFLDAAQRQKCLDEADAIALQLRGLDVNRVGHTNKVSALLDDGDFQSLATFLSDRVNHVPREAASALGIQRVV
jgi:hypothetical protein